LLRSNRASETRKSDITGLTAPTWQSVQGYHYEPWEAARLVVDTALLSQCDALVLIERYLGGADPSHPLV
jgi:hypothetical protein